MKLRSVLLAAPVLAALSFGALSPAAAAPTDAVTGLTANAVQRTGSSNSWTVSASWDANGATAYAVVIADQPSGGNTYATKGFAGSSGALTTSALVGDHDYWLRVQPEGGAVASTTFHTPALDTTAPTGVYRLDRTTAYLLSSEEDPFAAGQADFRLTQQSADPFTTRKVVAGDGTAARSWAAGSSYTLSYTKAGTYHPVVQLTDAYGNTSTTALPTVRALEDTIAPVVTIKTPAKPGKVASWRVVRGTVSDVGTGVAALGVYVMEKRGSVWWAYDFGKAKRWSKGFGSVAKTQQKLEVEPFFVADPGRSWRTGPIKGLTKGTLRVEAIGIDDAVNVGSAPLVTRRIR